MIAIPTILTGATLASLMLAIAVSDWRRYRVPDELTASALALRVADILLAQGAGFGALFDATLRGATLFVMFYGFRVVYRRVRGREGLGLGDVKLAGAAGAWVDWPLLPYVVEAAALVGLALALARAHGDGGAPRGDMKLPFAVGFAPAIFVGWSLSRFGI